MIALLNGENQMTLYNDLMVLALNCSEEQGQETGFLTLQAIRGTHVVWTAEIRGLLGNPCSNLNSGTEQDYLGQYWRAPNLLALAGRSDVVLIDAETGLLRERVSLRFAKKRSLEVLRLLVTPNGHGLVVVSTKRVVLFVDEDGVKMGLQWDTEDLITDVIGWTDDIVSFKAHDFSHPALPIVTKTININQSLV
jgi:hypothetical protein